MGNQLVLSWTNAAFSLQSIPRVQGVFTNIHGATGPFTNAFANTNRIVVEENKPMERRGTYLHAEALGQPAEESPDSASRTDPSASAPKRLPECP